METHIMQNNLLGIRLIRDFFSFILSLRFFLNSRANNFWFISLIVCKNGDTLTWQVSCITIWCTIEIDAFRYFDWCGWRCRWFWSKIQKSHWNTNHFELNLNRRCEILFFVRFVCVFASRWFFFYIFNVWLSLCVSCVWLDFFILRFFGISVLVCTNRKKTGPLTRQQQIYERKKKNFNTTLFSNFCVFCVSPYVYVCPPVRVSV